MKTIYVLPGKTDQVAFASGDRPTNCLVKRFSTEQLVAAYLAGLEAAAGYLDEYRILEQTRTAVTVEFRTGQDRQEQDFTFTTQGEKTAFKEGLADGDGYMQPAIYAEGVPGYEQLAALFTEAEFA